MISRPQITCDQIMPALGEATKIHGAYPSPNWSYSPARNPGSGGSFKALSSGHGFGEGHMSLKAKRCRHAAVAVREIAVAPFVAVRTRQQRPQP